MAAAAFGGQGRRSEARRRLMGVAEFFGSADECEKFK